MESKEIIKEYSNEDITVVWKPKSWKTAEGAWGPYWGIYGSGPSPKIKTDKEKTPFTKCS